MPAVLDLPVVCSSDSVWKAVSSRVYRQLNSGTEPGERGDTEKPGALGLPRGLLPVSSDLWQVERVSGWTR